MNEASIGNYKNEIEWKLDKAPSEIGFPVYRCCGAHAFNKEPVNATYFQLLVLESDCANH